MLLAAIILIAFCALVAAAPQEAMQITLALVWGVMLIGAVVTPILALFHVI